MAEQLRPSTGETVTVICRMPSGLWLDLYDQAEIETRGKSTAPVVGAPIPKARVRLQGARRDPRFHIRDNNLLGMAGRTEVSKDFWEAWCKQNPNFGPLTGGIIFAAQSERKGLDMLSERAAERTGFEGCDRDQLVGVKPLGEDED